MMQRDIISYMAILKREEYKNRSVYKFDIKKDPINKLCIFHCGNFEIFAYLLEKYSDILKMNLIITYYDDTFREKIINFPNIRILYLQKVENKGCDIGPFLLIIKYLLKNNHLYNNHTLFYKFHTKSVTKNQHWTESLIKNIIACNLPKTNKPLLLSSNEYVYSQNKSVNIENIKNIYNRNVTKETHSQSNFDLYFDTYNIEYTKSDFINPFTDLYSNANFYKYYEPDLRYFDDNALYTHWNNHGINEFHRKSNVNYIKNWAKKENYFIAGTMFGFNKSFLDSFKNYNIDYEYSILEEGYITNHNETKVHGWEYYFGFCTIYNEGKIYGYKDNILQNIYENKSKEIIPNFSIINRPYSESKIAFFMIIPGDNPDSGGYRTLLKYIKLLNDNSYTIDIYFGVCWNDEEVNMNVDILNKYGVPNCNNWFNANTDQINHFIHNLKKYNVIDIEKNNYYIGFKCQKKYDIIVANAWQTAEAVYKNKKSAKKLYYIIQDREELFYPNDVTLQNSVLKTYKSEFDYYCITQYLGNYFSSIYKLNDVKSSYMGVDLNKYYNFNNNRSNSVIIPYYRDIKPGRKPDLVEKIINMLSLNNTKCYVYPLNYVKIRNSNIINMGTMTETELNNLYNKHKVGIIFSNTNPSRLGFEMYASGLQVIEYESEFTKYDMPDKYFTKIKDEENILNIVNELFNKPYDNSFLQNIDINTDFKNFINLINQNS